MYKYYNLYLNDNDFCVQDNMLKINNEKDVKVKVIGELVDGKIYDIITRKEITLLKRDDIGKIFVPNITYYKKTILRNNDVSEELKKIASIYDYERYYTIMEEMEKWSINRYNMIINNDKKESFRRK